MIRTVKGSVDNDAKVVIDGLEKLPKEWVAKIKPEKSLGSLPAAGDTIIEKLERYTGEHGNLTSRIWMLLQPRLSAG